MLRLRGVPVATLCYTQLLGHSLFLASKCCHTYVRHLWKDRCQCSTHAQIMRAAIKNACSCTHSAHHHLLYNTERAHAETAWAEKPSCKAVLFTVALPCKVVA